VTRRKAEVQALSPALEKSGVAVRTLASKPFIGFVEFGLNLSTASARKASNYHSCPR
jgi:hypothetical protein